MWNDLIQELSQPGRRNSFLETEADGNEKISLPLRYSDLSDLEHEMVPEDDSEGEKAQHPVPAKSGS